MPDRAPAVVVCDDHGVTTDSAFDADVLVVGGGPAGSAAATMLARKGWRVRLYERDRFPREHVGESLLAASMPVLTELGVLPAVEAAGFLPKYGATMVWGRDPDPWSWSFRESSPRYPHAFQVVRAQFDEILLRNAAAEGVDVREGHRVLAADTGSAGASVREGHDGRETTARARIVVDASGQVIVTPERPEGVPVSDLVALVVAQIDGRCSVGELLDRLGAHIPPETLDQLRPGIVQALRLLHVDGVVAGFEDGAGS